MTLDLVRRIDTLRNYKKSFILSPAQWKSFKVKGLEWESVQFGDNEKSNVPDERGVYCFMIEHRDSSFPSHGYMAYVGLVGHNNNRTLRLRYADYLRDQKRAKRVHIYELLNKWKGSIYFHYAPVKDKRRSLKKIETALLDAIVPPYNKKDFSASFGSVAREAFT